MNIKECVRNYLEENNIDGLYNHEHGCSCYTNGKNFMWCGGQRGSECQAANEGTVTKTEMVPVEL